MSDPGTSSVLVTQVKCFDFCVFQPSTAVEPTCYFFDFLPRNPDLVFIIFHHFLPVFIIGAFSSFFPSFSSCLHLRILFSTFVTFFLHLSSVTSPHFHSFSSFVYSTFSSPSLSFFIFSNLSSPPPVFFPLSSSVLILLGLVFATGIVFNHTPSCLGQRPAKRWKYIYVTNTFCVGFIREEIRS